jgi:hypothetical protein
MREAFPEKARYIISSNTASSGTQLWTNTNKNYAGTDINHEILVHRRSIIRAYSMILGGAYRHLDVSTTGFCQNVGKCDCGVEKNLLQQIDGGVARK